MCDVFCQAEDGIRYVAVTGVQTCALPMVIASENAAHRIAAEWKAEGVRREGVFIPRRDTNARVNVWAGGRLFPRSEEHTSELQSRLHLVCRLLLGRQTTTLLILFEILSRA